MRRTLPMLVIFLVLLALPAHGAASGAPSYVAKSTEQMASQVKDLLTKERIFNAFDMIRRLQEAGVTWQPQLCAPSDLAGKLREDQLRIYAGIKLCDAIYAATFGQRKEVAESVEAIQRAQEKLNLRSHADIGAKYFTTLKKAAAEPESVNLQKLLDQAAADFVADIPALMSDPKAAEYLLDVMYGFTIEYLGTVNYFYAMGKEAARKMDAVVYRTSERKEWYPTILKLFQAFDRLNETIAVSGGTVVKVKFLELIVAAMNADYSHDFEAEKAVWMDINARYNAVRTAVLTPAK